MIGIRRKGDAGFKLQTIKGQPQDGKTTMPVRDYHRPAAACA